MPTQTDTATNWIDANKFPRDGTSQPGRITEALAPEYVSVDERTPEDFVEFAREFGKRLVYFNENNENAGTFEAFIGTIPKELVAAFLEAPDKFDRDQYSPLYRPHFTLFLAFLRLLQNAQAEVNTLTRRHLDFHFRRFLRMEARKAIPDRANLLFQMAERENQVLVPKGTAVGAGADALGRNRVYRTEKNLIVNRARIDKLHSIFIERKLTSIAQSWLDHLNDSEGGRLEMLRIAYGRPLPGDPLPDYKRARTNGAPIPLPDDDALDPLLRNLQKLVKLSSAGLGFTLAELRALVGLKEPTGNAVLDTQRQARYQRDLAAKHINPNALPFAPRQGGTLADQDFNALLGVETYLGVQITTLDQYWNMLLEVEDYFGMDIEAFAVLIEKLKVDTSDWRTSYERDVGYVSNVLEMAHHDKHRREYRKKLATEQTKHPENAEVAYLAMLQIALGDAVDVDMGSAIGDELARRLADECDELEERLSAFLSPVDSKALTDAHNAKRWNDVIDLLAHAMVMRAGKRKPQKTVWLDIHVAEDARKVLARRGTPNADGQLPFSTFGAPVVHDVLAPPTPKLGFVVTSPLLALSGGKRTITLTLGLRRPASSYEFNQMQHLFARTFGKHEGTIPISPLVIEVSTAKGWRRLKPNVTASGFGVYGTQVGEANLRWNETAPGLKIVVEMAEGEPALTPLPNAPDGMDTRWPAMRIMMQSAWSESQNRYIAYYREISSLLVGAAHLKVDVSGLVPTLLENDESVLDVNKPFEPFGGIPTSGARLSVGHPEIATKEIRKLGFIYEWMGAPANLTAHYANYPITASNAIPAFTTKVSMIDTSGVKVLASAANLFASGRTPIRIDSIVDPCPAEYTNVDGLDGRIATWPRFVQWELGPTDFQHRVYSIVASQKALELALDTTKGDVTKYQVRPPYTPKLKSLSLEYSSSVEILLYRPTNTELLDRLYHVHPFGVAELAANAPETGIPFVPRYDEESTLVIGLNNVVPPESVTLFVQVDDGSADRDIEAPIVTWSQLSGNEWKPLGRQVLSDATQGLQRSGIVELSLTNAAPNTLLPAQYTWVCASVTHDHASICDTRALHTQAVEAAFEDRDNSPEHYRKPLPAMTIAKLETPIAGIVGVTQPDPSFGGRLAEDEQWFSTRVSERLRHKARALSTWDFERIVLDAFPEIFKTKCIPAPEDNPGHVEVLVLPDVRIIPTNELGPKAPLPLLRTIEEYLGVRTAPCVDVSVRNAAFRAVRVRLGVRFAEPGNDSYWMGRLNEELNRFLSPWAYEEGVDVAVGGKIHASNIIDFVDRRPYVDYVAGITLFYTDDEGSNFSYIRPPGVRPAADVAPGPSSTVAEDTYEYCVKAEESDQVLVAFPKHRIDVITAEHYDVRKYQGISYMEIGMDFVVG
ncbi:MAG TPA: baseplate J/gp47 family protein [Polyangium sp.]|nr:baseplate J/gp47 family protein [Polyangium sp.]